MRIYNLKLEKRRERRAVGGRKRVVAGSVVAHGEDSQWSLKLERREGALVVAEMGETRDTELRQTSRSDHFSNTRQSSPTNSTTAPATVVCLSRDYEFRVLICGDGSFG